MSYKIILKEIGLVPLMLLGIYLLNPFTLYHYIGYLIIFYLLLFRKATFIEMLDSESLILLFFSLSYSAFDFLSSDYDRGIHIYIIQAIFPFFFYVLGKCLITSKMTHKNILTFVLLLAFIFSISALATIITDLVDGGFSQINRDFKSIWGGRLILATGLAGSLIYITSFPIFVIGRKNSFNLFERLILLIIFLTTLICAFRLGSRTIIALSASSLLFGIFYQLHILNIKDKLKFSIQVLIILIIAIYLVPFDLESDVFSTLGYRLTEGTSSVSSAGGRTELWSEAFDKMFKYPLGWSSNKFGHNMWLDVAKVSGLISFLLLLIFTYLTIRNTKRIFFQRNLDSTLRLCFVLFTIISLIFFFGEPILVGDINVFIFFCFQQGILKRTIELRKG